MAQKTDVWQPGNILLRAQNVVKNFIVGGREIEVLKSASLVLEKGEFAIIFGPSGSGKSTLLNILMGLEPPTSGEIEFCGVKLHEASVEEVTEFRKNNIGIVYQQANWVESLNVIENVSFPLLLRGIDKHRAATKAAEVLGLVGMGEWANFNPKELSSGQQQKVSLARALITDPPVVIADEPTGNLDYKSGEDLTKLLADLTKAGKAIIMVTHDLENLDYATRIFRFFDGRIAEDIRPQQLNINNVRQYIVDRQAQEKQNQTTTTINYKHNEGLERKSKFDHYRDAVKWLFGSLKPSKEKFLGSVTFIYEFFISILLSIISLLYKFIYRICSIRVVDKALGNTKYRVTNWYTTITNKIERYRNNTIKYADIFDISFKNTFAKRNRALVTIGGVALGIGFTVFLISLGYGLERLIISQVARLEQLRQVDTYPAVGETIIIDDEAVAELESFAAVEDVLPSTLVAGKVTYNDVDTDVVVQAAESAYLLSSNITTVSGNLFEDTESGESQISNEIVVNTAFVELLGLGQDASVGSTFVMEYILTEDTQVVSEEQNVLGINDESQNAVIAQNIDLGTELEEESVEDTNTFDYTVVGVVEFSDTPLLFVPISDVRAIGVSTFTQARVIVDAEDSVSEIRQSLETLGYRTTSILDTVNQIESFFGTVRIVFSIVGAVALAVASLGMFNTLTVSLLERTREVGLMKAIGMRGQEIKKLFLMEALTIGILGGLSGIALGIIFGNIISALVSLVAIARGSSYLQLTYIGIQPMLLVLLVAATVGVITGLYPANRATKISALNALRYE